MRKNYDKKVMSTPQKTKTDLRKKKRKVDEFGKSDMDLDVWIPLWDRTPHSPKFVTVAAFGPNVGVLLYIGCKGPAGFF